MAGGHGRVRREDAALPHALEIGVVQLEMLAPIELTLQQLEREQCRVPFVQVVDHARVVAHRLEQARAPHAQHDLLAETVVLVAAVERVRQRAVPLLVLGQVRIEEEHGHLVVAHPLHGIPEGRHVHSASLDRHGGAAVHRLQHILRAPLHRCFCLVPLAVQVLLEVALPVQQRDGDERDAEVGGRAQRITSEHAEPPAVGGDRLLQADLHGEIGDGGAGRAERHEFLELYRSGNGTRVPGGRYPRSVRRSMQVMVVREFYPGSAGVQLTEKLPQSVAPRTTTESGKNLPATQLAIPRHAATRRRATPTSSPTRTASRASRACGASSSDTDPATRPGCSRASPRARGRPATAPRGPTACA